MRELDVFFDGVLKLMERWDNRDAEDDINFVARALRRNLTFIKMIIKPNEFDSLDDFKRYLKETSDFLDNAKKENQDAK